MVSEKGMNNDLTFNAVTSTLHDYTIIENSN